MSAPPIPTSSAPSPITTTIPLPNTSTVLTISPSAPTNPASSTTTTANQPKPKASGVSTGAAAGIGLGCALAGFLLGALLLYLLTARRTSGSRSRRHRRRTDGFGLAAATRSTNDDGGARKYGGQVVESKALEQPMGLVRVVESNVPPPIEDRALAGEMSSLKTAVKNHVQSFYGEGHASGMESAVAELVEATRGVGLAVPAERLVGLLRDGGTRVLAVRHLVAWMVLARVGVDGDLGGSLLPPEVIGSLRSMSGLENDLLTRNAFQSMFRVTAGVLMRRTYPLQEPLQRDDPRSTNINKAIQTLEAFLKPLRNEKIDEVARVQGLQNIVRRAVDLAFIMFSQPMTYRFSWVDEAPGVTRNHLVVYPALLQVTAEDGQILRDPLVLYPQDRKDL